MGNQMTANNNKLGNILSVPSIGKRHIDLQDFNRVGLEPLDGWSCIRDNQNLSQAHWHRIHSDDKYRRGSKSPKCEVCGQTLRKRAGLSETVTEYSQHKKYFLGLVSHGKYEAYFCRTCAVSPTFRDDLIAKLPPRFKPTIADDGLDVYGYIAAIMAYGNNEKIAPHNCKLQPHPSLVVVTKETTTNKNGDAIVTTIGKAPQILNWPSVTYDLRHNEKLSELESGRIREEKRLQKEKEKTAKKKNVAKKTATNTATKQ